MKKNIGTLDAYVRISLGLFILGDGIVRKSPLKMALGSGKVAEGITRFCPMLYLMKVDTLNIENKTTSILKSKPIFNNL